MRRLAALGVMVATSALAAGHPPTMPQRDVDVTYRMVQPVEGGPELHQRTRWLVASGLMRVDTPSPDLYMIMDYRTKHVAMVKVNDRAVLDVASASLVAPGASRGSYTMKDSAVVAGVPCTDWETVDAAGQPTLLCLTADGVMLRASQKGVVLLEATAVSYAPQDPALFRAPDGFRHIDGSPPPAAAVPVAKPPGAKP